MVLEIGFLISVLGFIFSIYFNVKNHTRYSNADIAQDIKNLTEIGESVKYIAKDLEIIRLEIIKTNTINQENAKQILSMQKDIENLQEKYKNIARKIGDG